MPRRLCTERANRRESERREVAALQRVDLKVRSVQIRYKTEVPGVYE